MIPYAGRLSVIKVQVCFVTECSSESEDWEVMAGLKPVVETGLSFLLKARICSRARNAVESIE